METWQTPTFSPRLELGQKIGLPARTLRITWTPPGVRSPRTGRLATKVEIVIPVYNEEAGLEASIRRLHSYLQDRFPLGWLITVADNASLDRTWGVACRLAKASTAFGPCIWTRKGRGRALKAAWSASPAAVVAYMDVDLSTDLDGLLPLVAPLLRVTATWPSGPVSPPGPGWSGPSGS